MTTAAAHGFRYDRQPGPRTNVPYVLSLKFLKDPLTVLNDLAAKYGDISNFKFGRQGIYFVKHPDYIQSVLVTNQVTGFRKVHRKLESGTTIGKIVLSGF